MSATPDRRVARTRAALMSAFVAQILDEGYDTVSVEGIAARADVGRSTFYMHFSGKEDILREALTRPSGLLAALAGGAVARAAVIGQLDHFQQQRARNKVFFAGAARAVWVRRLAEMTEPRLQRLARQHHLRPALPLPLAARVIAEAQIGLVANWLTARPPLAKHEAVADALVGATQALTRALLRGGCDDPLLIARESLRVVAGDARP